jgi:hypothetical protein
MVRMVLPILRIHRCQSRISDHQEVLTIVMLCRERPIIRASNNDRPIQDHDFVVCPFMLIIKGDREPRAHEERDGLDRGIMRLGVGIQYDVHLYAPLVGTHKRPSQSHRIEEVGLHQDGLLGAPDALKDCANRTAVGAEIDGPPGFP